MLSKSQLYEISGKLIIFLLMMSVISSSHVSLSATALQDVPDSLKLNDGPYIFIEGDQLITKSIINGEVVQTVTKASEKETSFVPDSSEFNNLDKLAVLSDIHGQYELCLKLFRANHIIDDNNEWVFGKGHLVIAGDIFDRGDHVTEALWFIYELEKQARSVGGKVHYLMGNHEYMALQGDLRYIHEKYGKASALLETSYDELYSDQTLLGRWLRSKSTIMKINDIIFLHGGISKVFMGDQLDLDNANQRYRESIDMEKKDIKASDKYAKFYGRNSPIWYRGYFYDSLSVAHIDSVLYGLQARHIIVGHTSQEEVLKMYDGRIYAVDSSLKNGLYGEILIIEGGVYKRFTLDGKEVTFE